MTQHGSRGGGVAEEGGGGDIVVPPPVLQPQPALLSLRLPAADEEEYWRRCGTPALAWQDAWALLYTSFNV
jgi:hypothetical protein